MDAQDSWLVSSLSRYDFVSMFELPDPTFCLAWETPSVLLVASHHQNQTNEIIELALPRSLSHFGEKGSKEAQRDFELLRGGFSKQPVMEMAILPTTRLMACAGGSDGQVQLWSLCGGKGVLEKVQVTLECSSPRGHAKVAPSLESVDLYHATHANNLQMSDVLTGQVKWKFDCPAHFTGADICKMCVSERNELLVFLGDGHCVLLDHRQSRSVVFEFGQERSVGEELVCDEGRHAVCCRSGETALNSSIFTGQERTLSPNGVGEQAVDDDRASCSAHNKATDKRTNLSIDYHGDADDCQQTDVDRHVAAGHERKHTRVNSLTTSTAFTGSVTDHAVVCLSYLKQLHIYDMRQCSKPSSTATLCNLPSPWKCLQLEISPSNEFLSVSGFGHVVAVYKLDSLLSGKGCASFVHDGHVSDETIADVLCHSWHPDHPGLVLSADSDGHLHAWRGKYRS